MTVRYPNMTHSHFQLIAEVLDENNAGPELAKAFADRLGGTNWRFDRDKFIRVATENYDQTDDETSWPSDFGAW